MEEERNYTVYMHICPNGKKYVGITSKNPNERWCRDGSGYKNNKDFWKDIKYYGWDNIKHIITKDNLNKKDGYNLEIESIKKYNSIFPNGYNFALGGDIPPMLGKHLSKESKDKIRKSKENLSNESRTKMSNSAKKRYSRGDNIGLIEQQHKNLKGKNNPNYNNHKLKGHKMTNKQKENLSIGLKSSVKFQTYIKKNKGKNHSCYGRKRPKYELTNLCKKVICNNKIFDSITDFCLEYKLNRNTVGSWLNCKSPMPQKYIDLGLCFEGDNNKKYQKNKYNCVICENYKFYTVKSVSIKYKCDASLLCKYLNNKKPMPKKWKDKGLRYYNEETDKDLPIWNEKGDINE